MAAAVFLSLFPWLSFIIIIIVLVALTSFSVDLANAEHDIVTYGARPNSGTDSAKALESAWSAACGSTSEEVTIHVPDGLFAVSHVSFRGPCRSSKIVFRIDGTLVAPSNYGQTGEEWIAFRYVDGVSIYGGIIDGRGQSLWRCKAAAAHCPFGTRSLVFGKSKNIKISGLTSINSKLYHIVIDDCRGVTLRGVKIIAPGNSPNTDGIHVEMSSDVSITGSAIETGDDCVSVGPGTTNLWIERVRCGPGHGISIGSLGKTYREEGVQNVTVRLAVFSRTNNGVRIKTWGRPSDGFVKDVVFEHAVMRNVDNPIIITQNYCPHDKDCPNLTSGIKINGVTYNDIQGYSNTKVAVNFDCSPTNPCKRITLRNIKLVYVHDGDAQSSCKYVSGGTSTGFVIPPSCIECR